MNTQLETKDTLKRGKAFLELITRINSEDRAIAQSFVNQFELFDFNDYLTSQDGKRRHQYRHCVRFLQESGEAWQYISEDFKSSKGYRYLSPAKIGNRAFLPSVPSDIRKAIGDRYGVDIPSEGSFWDWFKDHTEIPLEITEGGGKSLSGLSHGFISIALFGCSCLGSPDLLPFLKGRDIRIALDSDTKPSAIKAVRRALSKHLKPLLKLAKSIKVIAWNNQTKGLDDLLASGGAVAYKNAIATAKTGKQWLTQYQLTIAHSRLEASKIKADLVLDCLPTEAELKALLDKYRDVFLAGAKGLGKSILGGAMVRAYSYALIPTPLESLARNNAERMSQGDRIVDYRTDCDRAQGKLIRSGGGYVTRLSFCTEAILCVKEQIETSLKNDCITFNDELDLQSNSLATSSTHSENGQRKINEQKYWEMQIRSKATLSVSADLTQYEAELWERKTGRKPFVIRVDTPKKKQTTELFFDELILRDKLDESIKNGDRVIVFCSRKSEAKFLEWQYRDYGAIAIHADNSGDKKFNLANGEGTVKDSPNAWLDENKPQIFIATPVLQSGFSITGNFFDKKFCLFHADSIAANKAMQMGDRYRPLVPTYIFAAESNHHHRHCTIDDILKTRKALAKIAGDSAIDENDSYYHYQAADNWSKAHFRADIMARLDDEIEGYSINDSECDKEQRKEYTELKKEFKAWRQNQKLDAPNWDRDKYKENKDRRDLSEVETLSKEKYQLANWSASDTEDITLSLIKRDNDGKKRRALERLEYQSFPLLAKSKDTDSKAIQLTHGAGIAYQDVSHYAIAQMALELTGLHEFLDFVLDGNSYHAGTTEVIVFAQKLKSLRNAEQTFIDKNGKTYAKHIDKLAEAGISLPCGIDATDTAYVGAMLSWLGLARVSQKVKMGSVRLNVYKLCETDLKITRDELTRRFKRNIDKEPKIYLTASHPYVERILDVSIPFLYPNTKGVDTPEKHTETEIQKQNSPIDTGGAVVAPAEPIPTPVEPKNDYEGESFLDRIRRLNAPLVARQAARYESERYGFSYV